MKKLLSLGLLIAAPVSFANVWDKVETSADFRYRLENSKDDFSDKSRNRQRIRARAGLKYQVDEVTSINLRLATAGGATSTNDTLGDSDGAAGAVFFDRAYVAHKIGDLTLNMGRIKNMFVRAGKNQMIWDSDLNFEGIHAGYQYGGAYVNLGSFWVEEDKTGNDDVTIASSQLGYKGKASGVKYNVGVSNYNYRHAKSAGFTSADGDGSTLTGEGMNILETYLEVAFDLGVPVKVFASAITNSEADEDNKGNIVGVELGKTEKKGSWKVGINQRTVELNAVEARFIDGDFAGKRTDNSGTVVYGKYMATDNAYLSMGLFNNTVNADEKYDPTKEAEDYSKLQVDYGIKF
ncbi:MAG: putative porin [Bacteriovoracaceae bacterium]|nr:putative porin [Bacteriovoracaceae bacterium]